MMTDVTGKPYISTPYISNDGIPSIRILISIHSIKHIFKDMSYPVDIMHCIIGLKLKILCNLMIGYI